MHFGIIEYTPELGAVEKNGRTTRHGTILYPEGFSVSPSSFRVIYLTAFTEGTVVFDVEFPGPLKGAALAQALKFKLEQLVPVPLEEVCTGYLKTARDNRHFRVYAVRRNVVQDLLQKVADAKLCCDCFMPAQLLDYNVKNAAKVYPSKLLIDYLNDDRGGNNLHLSTEPIPVSLRPVRHRKLRMAFNIALGISICLMLFLLANRLKQVVDEYMDLAKNEITLQEQFSEIMTERDQLLRADTMYKKISESRIGAVSPLPILLDLNGRLPDYMYISSYRQSADQVEVTIVSRKDDSALARTLMDSKLYQSDMRTSVQPDGSAVYNVTLRTK